MASNTINLNTYRAKLLSNTYGANNSPIYFNDGVPTILTTIGGQYEPVWVNNGVITAMTAGTTAQFYRGDKSWSNELIGNLSLVGNGTTSNGYTSAAPYLELKSSNDNKNVRIGLATLDNTNGLVIAQKDNTWSFLQVEGNLVQYSPNIDISQSNNGLSSGSLTSRLYFIDANSTELCRLQFTAASGGHTYTRLFTYNIVNSATRYAGFQSVLYKDGSATVSLVTDVATGSVVRMLDCQVSTSQTISIIAKGKIVPDATYTYDLGASNKAWREIYTHVFKLYANEKSYGNFYIAREGVAGDGTNYGTYGRTILTLGNNIARSTTANEGADNARGELIIYDLDSNSTTITAGKWSGQHLNVIGNTNSTANSTGTSYIILGNSTKKSAASASSTGYVRLYGDEDKYHDIYPGNPTANQIHYLPNATGWIVTGGNGTSTGAGGTDTPIYLKTDGTLASVTLKDTANKLINALDTGSSNLTANDYVITQYVGGGTTTTTYHRRPASNVVNKTLVDAALGSSDSTKFYRGDKTWSNTFTGNVFVTTASGDHYFEVKCTDTGVRLELDNSGSTNHGLWSSGYWTGSEYKASSSWMIYRNASGTNIVNGNCTGSSGSCTGNAATATKINTSTGAGGTNTPIYLKTDGTFASTNDKLGAIKESGQSYWGMRNAENGDAWIRTTTSGLIPVQSGSVGSGHSQLGTSSWFFSKAYVDEIHGHQLLLEGTTGTTMTAASTNPKITFQEGTSTQPVHLIYTDADAYRAPAGLKVIGGTSATPAWFEVEGSIYGGGAVNVSGSIYGGIYTANTAQSSEYVVQCRGGAGTIYMYSQAATSGNRGLYGVNSAGTAVAMLTINSSNQVSLYGNADSATALANTASDVSATAVTGALQAFWNANKTTLVRNKLISFTSSHSGRALHMGYFINGYDSNPYGGFFTAFYGTPYYSYASNGSFGCSELVRNNGGSYGISVTGSSGSCTGNAATASSVAWANVSGRPTIDKTTVIYQISRGANFDPIQSGYFAGMSTSTGITGDWWHILSMDWSGDNKNDWISQLALPTQDRTGVYYRSRHSSTTYAWKKLWTSGESITNAVWNDYAECRIADTQEPGRVLMEVGDDTLTPTNERMSHFAGISSDTWGFLQGETDVAKTPLAVAGRTLVYPYRDRNEYKPGDCVCAAPNGTVDIMTREEIVKYPDRIVGTISCVPEYEEWGGSDTNIEDRPPIKVNGRIWIKVR